MNPFQSLANDRVTLIKQDGQRFEDLRASVQSGRIFTFDPQIPIQEGDQFERRLPSGIVETFTVEDAGFQQGLRGIHSHYQSRVRKNTAPPPASVQPGRTPQVIYNLIGPNTRVNVQSSDSSTNVVNVESATLFGSLREAIENSLMDSTASGRLMQNVDAMESAVGTRAFAERYGEFVAAAADHMAVIAPFLPALTQLLL